jgi:hypothetical protein
MSETDAFKDRLTERVHDTGRPDLRNQCRGRDLEPVEMALADALMEVYATVGHDFSKVAEALAERGVVAPKSGGTNWTEALLAQELQAINAELDAAYEANGYGA